MNARRFTSRLAMIVVMMASLTAILPTVSASAGLVTSASAGQAKVLSKCTVPPCGDIYNYTNTSWPIRRKDSDSGPWINGSVGPGQHKGGYWNDGIDWDQYGVPYRCSINLTVNGVSRVSSNNTINGNRWFSFSSNETVKLNAYTCRGV
ncbi:hypothetical protein [Streptosporangium amethystogenes]|uniref:hypothetical protein n=1 Tax=Streptosporangium amethystogenes TaxID=2002 RepID=UPI0012FCE983|nr:hypothetical protein [Streptosporangium amethystogenes]